MIEALVAYIQDRGFTVHVMPRMLVLYKIVGDQKVGKNWALDNVELQQIPQFVLLWLADRHMMEIDDAIAARRALQS